MITKFIAYVGLSMYIFALLVKRGKADTLRMLDGMKSASRRIKLTSKGRK